MFSPNARAAVAASNAKEDRSSNSRDVAKPHGLGFRSGLTVIPVWLTAGSFAASTASLCRPGLSSALLEKGVNRNEGCNWYIGGEYVFRRSRFFDIAANIAYQRLRLPEGLWISRDDWGKGCTENQGDGAACDLSAADYAEIDLSYVVLGVDFIGRYPVVRVKGFELQVGGGGGIGLAIFTGPGVVQTPLGASPRSPDDATSCNTIADLGDTTRCTPRWWDDPDIDQDNDGVPTDDDPPDADEISGEGRYALCNGATCSKSDLQLFGSRKTKFFVPVLPVANIVASVRMIIKEAYAINFTGGFNTGFYFGGSLQYFFGRK